MFTFQIPMGLPILPTVSRNEYTVIHNCISNNIIGIIYEQIASYAPLTRCQWRAVANECVYLKESEMLW